MVETLLALGALVVGAGVCLFIVPPENSFMIGEHSISIAVVLIPALVVVFFLGCGLGFRRGQRKRRWFS